DRLHTEGRRFTDWYNSPTCAPTRSALLSGRHEFRNGVTHTILERERLTTDATTVAQVLQSAGYSTGIFGKWHQGDEAVYQPGQRGFDETFVHGAGGIGQTYPGSCGDAPGNTYFDPAILHNGKFEKAKGYCTDVFFNEATRWMESQRKSEKPFLCWIATNAPHGPYIARPEEAALYRDKGLGEEAANFFGMIHNIDDNIGRVLKQLDEWGLSENTLVVAMNDNGGTAGTKIYNAGMRGSKNSPWLGGTRAFSFWRWPGAITPGDCSALTAHVDFFRTLTELAGAKLDAKADQQVEGRSLIPLLQDPASPWEERTLFTHLGRWPYGSDPELGKFQGCAVRRGSYTLVSESKPSARRAPGTGPQWQLYDVKTDPGQQSDIAAAKPEMVTAMAAAYEQWWISVRANMVNEGAPLPKVNPFKEIYWKQFGITPTAEDLEQMNPERAKTLGNPRQKAEAKPKD
ncbi:MAG: arylsulfatase, partial [Verrucomicrobium sp.]